MSDELGGAAVIDAPVADTGGETNVDAAVTPQPDGSSQPVDKTQPDDKLDGRKQADSIKKRVAELRRQADAATDPKEKAALHVDAKRINDGLGKVAAYETVYPTVREAREVKALLDTVGGRDGLTQIQTTLANVEQIDGMLERGDPAVVNALWDEAKQGMPKIMPAMLDRFAKEDAAGYAKAIQPHAVRIFDEAGFPEAFDRMVQMFESGDAKGGKALAARMAQWFAGLRQGAPEAPKADPEREAWQKERDDYERKKNDEAVNTAYNAVIDHAGPVIDKHLKPIVAKLNLSPEQYSLLREDAWNDLQKTRNEDATYKTVAPAKFKQSIQAATDYMKGETEARALASAQRVAKARYGHQLKNGAAPAVKQNPTAPPAPGVIRGKEPDPSEIDYSAKGIAAARKAGYKDMADMILSGKAPLKAGGIRQWR